MKKIITIILVAISLIMTTAAAYAHSGRTTLGRWHTVRTPGSGRIVGTIHFH